MHFAIGFVRLIRHQNRPVNAPSKTVHINYKRPSVIWMSVLAFGGILAQNNMVGVRSWKSLKTKSKLESKYVNKFRKGCKPVYIGLIGVFAIKRLTLPKYIYGLTRSIFRALLAIKRNKG